MILIRISSRIKNNDFGILHVVNYVVKDKALLNHSYYFSFRNQNNCPTYYEFVDRLYLPKN